MDLFSFISLAASAILTALGFILYANTRHMLKIADNGEPPDAKLKKKNRLFLVLTLMAGWYLIGTVISIVFHYGLGGTKALSFKFNMFSERISLFGFTVAKTTVVSWVIIAIVLVFGLIFRFILLPRFDPDNPRGFQNIIELAIEAMDSFTRKTVGAYADRIAPYMFSVALFMVLCAASELFGIRAPTSDLVVTAAMGIITFVLINYYGIRKKGIAGRIKSLAQPFPVILPMKILSDISVPVSLACRLFGNMLGGMIVMELLKNVLGGYASGIPAVLGIYFNLFHPLIQAYIFIILSLTFINEAIE